MKIKIPDLLAEVLNAGASDLHIGTGHVPSLRVDGELHPLASYPPLTAEDTERAISELLLPEQMGVYAQKYVALGARVVGGCCGTNPTFIRAIAKALKG